MGHTLFPEIFLEFLLCYFQIYIQIQPVFVYCIIFSTEGRFIIDRARVSQSRGRHCAAGFIAHNGGQRTVQLKANISAWEYHSSYVSSVLESILDNSERISSALAVRATRIIVRAILYPPEWIRSDSLFRVKIFKWITGDSLWGIYEFVWVSGLIALVFGGDMFC